MSVKATAPVFALGIANCCTASAPVVTLKNGMLMTGKPLGAEATLNRVTKLCTRSR